VIKRTTVMNKAINNGLSRRIKPALCVVVTMGFVAVDDCVGAVIVEVAVGEDEDDDCGDVGGDESVDSDDVVVIVTVIVAVVAVLVVSVTVMV